MGLLDKLRETIIGDDKPKSFEVNFDQGRMGMTLESGPNGEAVVVAGLMLSTRYSTHALLCVGQIYIIRYCTPLYLTLSVSSKAVDDRFLHKQRGQQEYKMYYYEFY